MPDRTASGGAIAHPPSSFRDFACRTALAALAFSAPLAGKVVLTTPSPLVQRGSPVHFYAALEGGQTTKWLWELEEPLDAMRLRGHVPTWGLGHVSVQTFPWDASGLNARAELSVTLVPAMLTLTAPETVGSEDACDILATRADGKTPACHWRLLDSQGGRIQGEGGTRRYEAPAVTAPATFHVWAIDEEGFEAMTAIRVLPRAVLRLGTPHLISGNQSTLGACRKDGKAADWAYGVRESQGGGAIAAGPEGTVLYTAPMVAVPSTFTLQAQDRHNPRDLATAQVHVLPRAVPSRGEAPGDSYDCLFQTVLPRTLGGPLVPVPEASLLVGALEHPANPWHETAFHNLAAIVFAEDDPPMGPLQRQWLVRDAEGLHAVSAPGTVTPLLPTLRAITTLAVRQPCTTRKSGILAP